MTTILMPNVEVATHFLQALDPLGEFAFATFDDRGDDKSLARRLNGTLDEHVADLSALNNCGAGVFITVNATDGKGYGAANVTKVRAAFVDLDGADLKLVESWTLAPHLIVESSPNRWHAYWLIEGLNTDGFRAIQQALAARFDGDRAVCDLGRVMRLPGFFHCKETPREVRLHATKCDLAAYPAEMFKAACSAHPDSSKRPPIPIATVEEGSRNSTLTSIAGRLRRKGADADELTSELLRENAARCTPPLSPKEIEGIATSVMRYPPARSTTIGIEATDTGNGQRFAQQHGHDLKYVPELAKWLAWRGTHWEADKAGEVFERAKETAKSIFDDAASSAAESVRSTLAKHAVQSLNRPRLNAMIAMASTEPAITQRMDRFDADDFVLGVQNGVVNLRDGSFRESRREDYITLRSGTHFDRDGTCPKFHAFLGRVTGEDVELQAYLQRLAGYALTASTREQCFAFLYGHGANGKTTFLDVLMQLCGGYATQTQPETLMARRTGGASSDLARLVGKRLVVSNEVREGAHLEENLVKQLVGGDVVTARFLYQEHFEFRPKFKLLIAGNHQPVIKGDDGGIWRRVHLVPFVNTIPEKDRDKQLGEKLAAELPGILNWAIEGCLAWQKRGLDAPAVITDATKAYRKEMDLLGAWIDQECHPIPGVRTPSRQLYENYRNWCESAGVKPLSQMVFVRKLDTRGFHRHHTRTGNVIQGLALRKPSLTLVA